MGDVVSLETDKSTFSPPSLPASREKRHVTCTSSKSLSWTFRLLLQCLILGFEDATEVSELAFYESLLKAVIMDGNVIVGLI
jgi:hypothetical protein